MQRAEVQAPPPAGTDPDRESVALAQAGDTRAFEVLVRRYQRWVFTLALRMLGDRAEAEDAAQEVFVRAYRGLREFQGASRFSTWLYAIASRHCLTALQARARRPRPAGTPGGGAGAGDDPPPDLVVRLPDGAPLADAVLERLEVAALVQEEVQRLSEDHRAVLVLRDIQGLAYEEIAEVLGLELGTVRSRLHRARMELKARLAPHLSAVPRSPLGGEGRAEGEFRKRRDGDEP
jgi:RNA polymerase sigma-70 factor (ECF subfamily)